MRSFMPSPGRLVVLTQWGRLGHLATTDSDTVNFMAHADVLRTASHVDLCI